jgi:hypothetical protein
VSDTPESVDWWLAVDGRWYPPHLHPSAQAAPPLVEVKELTSESRLRPTVTREPSAEGGLGSAAKEQSSGSHSASLTAPSASVLSGAQRSNATILSMEVVSGSSKSRWLLLGGVAAALLIAGLAGFMIARKGDAADTSAPVASGLAASKPTSSTTTTSTTAVPPPTTASPPVTTPPPPPPPPTSFELPPSPPTTRFSPPPTTSPFSAQERSVLTAVGLGGSTAQPVQQDFLRIATQACGKATSALELDQSLGTITYFDGSSSGPQDPLRTASDGIYFNMDVLTAPSPEFAQRWKTNPVLLVGQLRVAASSFCPEHNEAFAVVEAVTRQTGNEVDDGIPWTTTRLEWP